MVVESVHPSLLIVLLAVICLCLITITVTLGLMAYDIRRTLHGVNTLLPGLRRSLHQAHRLLMMANGTTERVAAVIQGACDTATSTLHALEDWKRQGTRWVRQRFGNGAGADPRRHRRSWS